MSVVLVAACSSGCAAPTGPTDPDPPSPTVSANGSCDLAFGPSCDPTPTPAGPSSSVTRTRVTGHWKGTYTCGQGLTGLDLEITDQGAGAVAAVFSFGPVKSNPGVPNGSYSMTGRLDPDLLTLTPKAWIVHPSGYVMVGLRAVLPGNDSRVLAGTVTDGGCTTFRVER